MKSLIDSIPALLFLGAVFIYDIYIATAVLIVALFALVLGYAISEKRIHRLHLGTALVALVLGGLTLAVRDPLFIKYKPTAVYLCFALLLLGSHFIGKQVILRRLGETALTLPDTLWRQINAAWALFFLFCAGLNAALVPLLSDEQWALLKTFGFTGLMFLFLLAHLPFVHPHLPEDGEESA